MRRTPLSIAKLKINTMTPNMNSDAVRAALMFGFSVSEIETAQSLCEYGPVLKIFKNGRPCVLKRTGFPRSSGPAIADWLHGLVSRGVRCVAPLDGFAENPRRLPEDKWPGDWVVYPFIEGRSYSGSKYDLYKAGELLGDLHANVSESAVDMISEPKLPIRDLNWVKSHLEMAMRTCETKIKEFSAWSERVHRIVAIHEECRLNLEKLELVTVPCSWDYKASNLVFDSKNVPYLIDPDHAGRIPRIYDLAISLMLFHNDHQSSPGRIFLPGEWFIFCSGYMSKVALGQDEMSSWDSVLVCAWVDQALWLLAHWPEGWDDEREARYLGSLSWFNPDEYNILPSMRNFGDLTAKERMNVLSYFIDLDGKINALPKKPLPRRMILRYIADRLPSYGHLTESAVNDTLSQWHTFGDPALLRRELCEAGILMRDRGGLSYYKPTVTEIEQVAT